MPSTSDPEPRHQLDSMNPTEEQQNEEDFSFEELQMELQRLQYQLQEHGRSIFGEQLATARNSTPTPPAVVEQIPPQQAPPQRSPLLAHEEEAIADTKTSTHHRHNNCKISKNERHLKAENQNLRRQLAEEREELHRLRALKSVTEEKMASRMAHLQERLKIILQNEKKLEKRRAADAEGWRAEFTALRHRLQSAEHRQRKLIVIGSIRDEDHRETVIERHKKLEKIQLLKNKTRNSIKTAPGAAAKDFGGRRIEEKSENEEIDPFNCNDLNQEGLEECMGQLSQELNALKSALGTLEQQIYKG